MFTKQNRARTKAQSQRARAQRFHADPQSLPAPTGGWNARDALADMAPDDAVSMVNMWPSTTDVMVRRGYDQWATGLGVACESLMPYNSPTESTLFAAAGTSFYDVTAPGVAGAPVETGLTNARWQSTNFATSGGNFMYAVNGVDNPRLWDGSTWESIDSGSTPAITGVTTTLLNHVNVFKRRLWFVERASLRVWYLPVDSIGGEAQMLDFQSLAGLGGYLVEMGTWTIDSGTGSDDLAVFITSQGQVIVYRGIDPSNEVTWALAGIWNVGAPIGNRCMQKFGGDLLIATFDGLFALSKLLQSDTVDLKDALSDKIRLAMSEAATAYSGNFGWDVTVFPQANMVILNIPVEEGAAQEQFVMNSINRSWTRFTNWSANCFMLFNDEPYFGSAGMVCKAWTNFTDNVAPIEASALQAFNYFGSRGQEKRFTMMRPILNTNGFPAVLANVNVDYSLEQPTTPASFSPQPISLWDVALWDVGLWAGQVVTQSNWTSVTGLGYCASIRMAIDIDSPVAAGGAVWGVGLWGVNKWSYSDGAEVVLRVNGFDLSMEDGSIV